MTDSPESRDAENWERLQALFHLAEDAPPDQLDAVLLAATDDRDLRRRAKALLLAARSAPAADPAPAPSRRGRIGPYSVLRHLGAGGIGTVYLVERNVGGTVQRAALKVLSLHAAGPFFADRFAREQHILASLDHPNITRLFDAGITHDGEPYLVMEFVDGLHLDTFCDDHALPVTARLHLFLHVCEAVAYAHRNLIVHLDLKPSNILVAAAQPDAPPADATVKLLDFGTSKLIQPDSLLTTTVLATPAYASPEQLRNEPVTTACDIYALGAILFELLSGRRPNQDSSVAIMIERSLKELPPEPITGVVTPEAAAYRGLTQTRLLNLLRGDLATIVAKCLAPRPSDRYTTVDALITDLERYLTGRPILARPQTTTYRLTKFVRRNRKAVVTGVFAVLALAATSTYALWRQHQAVVAGQRALQMQTFIYRLFKLANANYTGKPAATVPEFLELGVKVVPDFIKSPADLRAAQLSLAESMFDNGALAQAQPVFLQVIDSAKAAGDIATEAEAEAYAGNIQYTQGEGDMGKSLFEHALALSHSEAVSPSQRVRIEVDYVENRADRGIRAESDGRLLQFAVDESRRRHLPQREQALAIEKLADYHSQRNEFAVAETLAKEAYVIYQSEPYAVCDQADAAILLANIRYNHADYAGALPDFLQGYHGYRACLGPESIPALSMQVLVARDMLRLNQPQPVISMLEAALPVWRKVSPNNTDLSAPLIFLSRAYLMNSQFAQSERAIREALKVQQGRVDPNTVRVAICELLLAQALDGQHKDQEALQHAQIADHVYTSLPVLNPGERGYATQAHSLLLDLQARLGNSTAQTPVTPQPARTLQLAPPITLSRRK